jgi:hypothetical protein
MQTLPRHINPFAMMLDPQAVIAQIERSERLAHLQSRICRPLDKPLLGGVADDGSESDHMADGDIDRSTVLSNDSGFDLLFGRQSPTDQRSAA